MLAALASTYNWLIKSLATVLKDMPMLVSFARPEVADLMLRVFDRPLHPELFECHGLTRVTHEDSQLEVQLCPAGHLLTFRRGRQVLTEAISEKQQSLPQQKRVMEHRLRGCRTQTITCAGVKYSVGCQLEKLNVDVFQRMHEELLVDSLKADLSRIYPSASRFAPGALSVVRADVCDASLIVHTFHTFPDNCSIVKTQSLIELR